MSEPIFDRAARRRATVRAILGRPGSLRRALIFSLVVVGLAALLYVRADFLGRIAIFLLAVVLVTAILRARSMAVGDEDELRAALRRESKTRTQSACESEQDFAVTDEEWARIQEALRARESGAPEGAPPPPSLEEDRWGPTE